MSCVALSFRIFKNWFAIWFGLVPEEHFEVTEHLWEMFVETELLESVLSYNAKILCFMYVKYGFLLNSIEYELCVGLMS